MLKKITQTQAMFCMLLCGMMWSIAGVIIKLIPWNSLVIGGIRSIIAGLVLYLFMRAMGHRLVVNRHTCFAAGWLTATMVLFVSAIKLTTSANAIVLQYLSPVFIVIIGFLFFRQRFPFIDIIVVFISLAGISLFFFDQLSPGKMLGNIMGLASGVTFGAFFITTGRLTDAQSSTSALLLAQVFHAIICIPFYFIYPPTPQPMAVLAVLVLGVFQLGLPYALYHIASRRCSALACSLLAMAEPIFNPIWVFLAIGERPGPFALAGGAVVLVTVTLWCAYKARAAQAQPEAQTQTQTV